MNFDSPRRRGEGVVSALAPRARDCLAIAASRLEGERSALGWGFAPVKAAGRYVDVLSRRKSLKENWQDVTMNREDLAAFLASLKKLRDGRVSRYSSTSSRHV